MQRPDIKPQFLFQLPAIDLNGSEAVAATHDPFVKRAFDLVFSLIVILFICSWLFPILAVLILLESRGPVIFKQKRTGKNNTDFWCYKFRSMKVNKDSNHKQAGRYDDRTTKVGRFLRKTSLDELPQFFNVLIGDMSVVGPRPHMLQHTEEYKNSIENYMSRHFMKPGITGWAQIKGYRGQTTFDLMEKRVQHDIWYMENWSASLDCKIVLLTIFHVVKGHENAY